MSGTRDPPAADTGPDTEGTDVGEGAGSAREGAPDRPVGVDGTAGTDGADVATETSPPARNWGPTGLSVGLSLLLAATVVGLLVSRVAVPRPAAAGVLGAALLAGALRVGGRERFRLLATVAESLLLLPVGLSLTVAIGGAVLLQYREAFPVASPADIPAPALDILATTGLVAGVTLATLGALAATGDLLTGRTLRRTFDRALRLGLPPTAVAIVLGGLTVLSSPEVPPTVDLAVALRTTLGAAGGILLSPDLTQVPLTTLVGLLAVTTWSVTRVVHALPTDELAVRRTEPGREWEAATATPNGDAVPEGGAVPEGDREADDGRTDDGEVGSDEAETTSEGSGTGGHARTEDEAAAVAAALERVGRALMPWTFLFAVTALFLWIFEIGFGPSELAERMGARSASLLYGVATAPAPRLVLVGVVAIAALVILVARFLQRSARARTGAVVAGYVPYAIGLCVVPLAFGVHAPVLGRGIPLVADLLSGFGEPFSRVATGVVAFYGGGVVLLAFLGGALLLAAGVVSLLWAGITFGVSAGDPVGPVVAGTGLLSAAGFLGAAGGPTWLVAVGVVAAVLVRDLGRYGTVLGREVGRRAPTGRAEVVHAVGAVPAALVGFGLVLALARAVTGTPVAPAIPVQAPLLGALAGIVLLVLALR